MKSYPDTQYLKQILDYNPETGIFTWKNKINGTRNIKGQPAGCIKKRSGYHKIVIDYQEYLSHRLAFVWMGYPLPHQVDHINGIRHDNRWSNLRAATNSLNGLNRKATSNTGRKGVHRTKKGLYSVRVHLGEFKSKEEAVDAWNKVMKYWYGEKVYEEWVNC